MCINKRVWDREDINIAWDKKISINWNFLVTASQQTNQFPEILEKKLHPLKGLE